MAHFRSCLFFSLVLLTGCSSALDSSDVANLGAGDATGSALSGDYTFDLDLAQFDCSQGLAFYYVGDVEDAVIQQSDGRLTIFFPDPLFTDFPRFAGGVDADGSFVVGGTNEEDGATAVMVVDGTTSGSRLVGAFTLRVYASDLECNGTGSITFTR